MTKPPYPEVWTLQLPTISLTYEAAMVSCTGLTIWSLETTTANTSNPHGLRHISVEKKQDEGN